MDQNFGQTDIITDNIERMNKILSHTTKEYTNMKTEIDKMSSIIKTVQPKQRRELLRVMPRIISTYELLLESITKLVLLFESALELERELGALEAKILELQTQCLHLGFGESPLTAHQLSGLDLQQQQIQYGGSRATDDWLARAGGRGWQ